MTILFFFQAVAKKETSEEKTLFSDDDMPSDVDLNDPYFSSELKPDSNKSELNSTLYF